MAKTVEGECKLCGKFGKLTFEHVPPESAFNSTAVLEYSADATIEMMSGANGRLPWDFSGLSGKVKQRGSGGYYLCSECNNNTGTWYISEYVKLANTFHNIIQNEHLQVGDRVNFQLTDVYPQRVLKAIMTMYCDINNGCMGDNQLREYLLDKTSTDFNSEKYKVFIYMLSPNMRRLRGVSVYVMDNNELVTISEIGTYPIGTILCIDKPESYNPDGLLINSFADCAYDEKCNLDVPGIPYLEINSLFPADFRAKEAFLK